MAFNIIRNLVSVHGKKLGYTKDGQLCMDGTPLNPPLAWDLWRGAPMLATADPAYAFGMFDDFVYPVTTAISDVTAWAVMSDGGTGTPVFQDAAGGWFNIVTAAVDNDYSAYKSVTQPFNFATAGKKLWAEMRFKVAEATILESTWWFGLTDTVTTGGMQANAAGPLASYDGALIWKEPETAMTVNFETSNAGTQSTLTAFATSVTDTVQRAGFYFDGAATTGTITPYFYNGTTYTVGTAKNITLSGLEEMNLVYGIKAGPSGAAETLQVDYVKCVQLR